MHKITEQQFYDFWHSVVKLYFPKARIKFKNKSFFMNFLNFFVCIFNRGFMKSYVTTIGTTIYFPSNQWLQSNPTSSFSILAHESVHMYDSSRDKLYPIKYLFPQVLFVFSFLSVLSFISLWFLLFLVFLVFLLPFPAPWRTKYEVNGYSMTMHTHELLSPGVKYNPLDDAERLSKYFTSSAYYWMCRDKEKVVRELQEKYSSNSKDHELFLGVYSWLKAQKP